MSKESRENARRAQSDLKTAQSHARRAKDYFRQAGDTEGEKKADAVEKTAGDGVEYVDKRLGKD